MWLSGSPVSVVVGSSAACCEALSVYVGNSVDNFVTEKNTVTITIPNTSTTIKMVNTSDSQPGTPRFDKRLGMGNTVIVMTAASKIGLIMEADPRIPNRITKIAAARPGKSPGDQMIIHVLHPK